MVKNDLYRFSKHRARETRGAWYLLLSVLSQGFVGELEFYARFLSVLFLPRFTVVSIRFG